MVNPEELEDYSEPPAMNLEEPEDFLVVPLDNGGVRVRLDRTTHGRVMCCLCFDWCTHDQLNPVEDGGVEDVCKPCAEKEKQCTG